MSRPRPMVLAVAALLLQVMTQTVFAQTTGTLSGRVTSPDGLPLPGATVLVTSSILQGSRTTVSSTTGDYVVPMLPPGTYTVAVEIGDFRTVREARFRLRNGKLSGARGEQKALPRKAAERDHDPHVR